MHRYWSAQHTTSSTEDDADASNSSGRVPLHPTRKSSDYSGADEFDARSEQDFLRSVPIRRVDFHHKEDDSSRHSARWYLASYHASAPHATSLKPGLEDKSPDDGRRRGYVEDTGDYRSTRTRSVQQAQLPSLFGRQGLPTVSTPSPVPSLREAAEIPAFRSARNTVQAFPYEYEVNSSPSSGAETYPTHPLVGRERFSVKLEIKESPQSVDASELSQTDKKKRKARYCKVPECEKLVVDQGVCIRHGGGKRCKVDGCDCRAQNRGLCWKHGGYTICKVADCGKRAKSRGMCWSHGGGTRCKTQDCAKIAVSRGHCWAHGGGKRCKIPECQKPAALRLKNFCSEHHGLYCRNPRSDSLLETSRYQYE